MEDASRELLRTIYVGAKSGTEVIIGLLPKVTDRVLKREAAVQLDAYAGYAGRAEMLMGEKQIKGITFPLNERLSVRGGVLLETAGVQTQEELLRILQESTRESAKSMRQAVAYFGNKGCDGDIVALGQRMVGFEAAKGESLRTLKLEKQEDDEKGTVT